MEVLHHVDVDRMRALKERGEFYWLDLMRPSESELDTLGAVLDLPPLGLEDAKEFRQRPKLDDYGGQVQLVFYGADGDGEPVEVHLHLSGDHIVTIRRVACDALDRPRRAVEERLVRSELDLVFRILDALADSLAQLVERKAERVDELQEEAFEHPSDMVRRDIARLRGELFRIQQLLRPQRDLLASGGELLETLPGLQGEAARHPFREVHDVLVSTVGRVDYLRELLAEAVGIYLSSNANRLNALATRLALLGTIFLPLTFVTGFFGQNFGWLVRHISSRHAFLVWTIAPTLTVLLLTAALGVLGTRRR
jgi:magnesium transporter